MGQMRDDIFTKILQAIASKMFVKMSSQALISMMMQTMIKSSNINFVSILCPNFVSILCPNFVSILCRCPSILSIILGLAVLKMRLGGGLEGGGLGCFPASLGIKLKLVRGVRRLEGVRAQTQEHVTGLQPP